MSTAIIIPCHSYPELLPRALESVRCQTVQPDVICLRLDGVEDRRPYIDAVEQWRTHSTNISVVWHPQMGIASTMNNALVCLREDGLGWYLRLDEDDELNPRALEYMHLSTTLCDREIHYTDWIKKGTWRGYTMVPEYSKERLLAGPFILSTALISMSAWIQVREYNHVGYDPNVSAWEDYLFYLEAVCLGCSAAKIGLPLVRYYRHGQSRSSNVDKNPRPVIDYVRDKILRMYGTEVTIGANKA